MIDWSQSALDDLNKIAEFIYNRSGFDEANIVVDLIEATVSTIDQPMNLSRPGRVDSTRELLITYKKKPQYIAVYEKDANDVHTVLVVKHTLQKYP